MLKLWTFQPHTVWQELQTNGFLYVNPKLTDPDFRWSNRWMRKQMKLRLTMHEGYLPWWGHLKKPDMCCCYHLLPNSKGVCLELQIDPVRVLISDYMSWHMVLNRSFLPLSNDDENEWEKVDALHSIHFREKPTDLQKRIVRSWKSVFDLDALRESDLWSAEILQACFERLDLRDVVTVTEVKMRDFLPI